LNEQKIVTGCARWSRDLNKFAELVSVFYITSEYVKFYKISEGVFRGVKFSALYGAECHWYSAPTESLVHYINGQNSFGILQLCSSIPKEF